MTITRHLDAATLMSFAAGSLPGALAAVAAAHVAMCGRCREEVAVLERVGAALVADLPEAELARAGPAMPDIDLSPTAAAAFASADEVPAPLVRLVGPSLDRVRWRWIAPGLWHRPLPIDGRGALQLLKGSPGVRVPEHGHGGSELTLVLRGALVDRSGRYGPGDVADVDEEIERHAPAADPDAGCICVVANEQPSRFRNLLARLLQPWHGL
jgi:putative transcriptional regulator